MTLTAWVMDFLTWTPWRSAPADPVEPTASDREQLFQRLAALNEHEAATRATRQAAIESLTRELSSASAHVASLRQRLSALEGQAFTESMAVSATRDALTARITETAPSCLGLFLNEVDRELTRLRGMEATTIPSGSKSYRTNAASIARRVTALCKARERAVALQTENLSLEHVQAEITRLRRGLPDIVSEDVSGPVASALLRP